MFPASGACSEAAQLRSEIEAALLQAIPGLYARIELLPMGMNTVSKKCCRWITGAAKHRAKLLKTEGLST